MDNVQIIQQVYKDFGAGNVAGVLSFFDNDVEWVRPGEPDIPFSGTFKGIEGIGKFLSLVAQNVRIKEYYPKQFLSNNDTVVVIGEDTAEAIPTGKSYTTHWVQEFVLRDGKIIYGRAFIDTLQVAKTFKP
jgi:ketosteroid isomerase-like protein